MESNNLGIADIAGNLAFARKAGKTIKFLNFIKTATAVAAIIYVIWNVLFGIFNE